jgi:hypothetical protein
MLSVNGLLGLLDDLVCELHYRTAFHAHEVVVMAVSVGVLILTRPVIRTGAPREARLGKELDGAKHRRLPNTRVDASCRSDEFVGGDMALGVQERAEYRFAGFGHLKAALAKEALEDCSCITLHFHPLLFMILIINIILLRPMSSAPARNATGADALLLESSPSQ